MSVILTILFVITSYHNWKDLAFEKFSSGTYTATTLDLPSRTANESPYNFRVKNDTLAIESEIRQIEAKADSLMQLGKSLLSQSKAQKDYAEITNLFNKSIHIFIELDYKNEHADALNHLAECYLNQGKLLEADHHLQRALEILTISGHHYIHDTYHILQLVHNIRGQLDKSLFYSLENVKSMEQTKDTTHAGLYYHFVAENYSALGAHEKSMEWYNKALEVQNSLTPTLLYHIVNLANKELLLLDKKQQALDLLLKVAPNEGSSGIADIEEAKGYTYSAMGKQARANKHFTEMLRLYNQDSMSNDLLRKKSVANLKLGSYYVDLKQYKKAKDYLLNSFELSSVPNKTKANLMLFKVDSALGNYLNAINYFQQYNRLNDSIFNEEKSRQFQEIQIQYETIRNEIKIKDLQGENLLKSIELNRANLIKKIILIGLILFIGVTLLLYKGHKDKKRINTTLLSQKGEIAQQNYTLQELLSEKEWLIKEVHHRVKNNLQIVMSLLNTQSKYIKNPGIYSALRKSQARLFAISLIHQKLYTTENSNLIDINSYIENLIHYLKESFDEDLRITYELDVDRIMLQEDQAIPVGLILNEAITNSIKHAFPNNPKQGVITIRMKSQNGHYLLSIKDNGVGLAAEDYPNSSPSMGMTLIEGLSKQLGGTLKIENNQGTSIKVMFGQLTISDIYAQNSKD